MLVYSSTLCTLYVYVFCLLLELTYQPPVSFVFRRFFILRIPFDPSVFCALMQVSIVQPYSERCRVLQ